MNAEAFLIREARILRCGNDGGHAYAVGLSTYNHDDVKAYVFMADKVEESLLISRVSAPFTVVSPRYDFVVGVGLSLWECRFADSPR